MDFWQQYRAIDARDVRFDGQFVTAVSSTGIYCRPSCPARTPKPANVQFYRTSAAAHEAGYRACKRCLPEAVPGTPEWNLRSDVAARSMRLIADGEVDRSGVVGLAGKLGYSTRQLNRILREELGAGPLALARATRAQTARTLLTATSMKLSDVAFAAGFSSIRQFNDTVQEVFDLTPSQLRGADSLSRAPRRSADRPAGAAAPAFPGLILTLPVRAPYDNGIFGFLAARALPGVEQGTDGSYARLMQLPGGQGWFRAFPVAGTDAPAGLRVELSLESLSDLPVLLSRIRRLFDLDADPAAVDAALSGSALFAPLAAAVPGIRLPGAVDPAELLIRAMIGQQITVSAARTALTSLAEAGTPSVLSQPGFERLFPNPAQIADVAGSVLRGPARRIEAVRRTAEGLADGSIRLGVEDDPRSLADRLLPLPGIGPWTVNYVAMRVLGATDVHLGNDAAIRNGWAALTGSGGPAAGPATKAEAAAALSDAMSAVSPWRSYATMHLWRVASGIPARASGTRRVHAARPGPSPDAFTPAPSTESKDNQ
ncbi:DNA-3-methyladenine glycosylase 2 family protein [Arthrobacter sp. MSA 4-2]|uniref:DNA-3-methyladenine glycosylase 2 family protein n=1 Tax=Arthrobacter sp. MSA 4-2 TaxID=2794349 RepID=UPI0018E763CD|nr:AlkA N-terminal domain-containing protein [Arthrobacter sp. MSA 4-2]MBJ2121330.1 DNA-3-methyladenine glycosylase 2 family protein [Arthrobacter sp. MSA 4-2]